MTAGAKQEGCPCGSGLPYVECCGPIVERFELAITAEALMRSRYSAFSRGNNDYLLYSWHPGTRPPVAVTRGDRSWTKLEVIAVRGGGAEDLEGTVEFAAHYVEDLKFHVIHEVSRFERWNGRWVYRDGVHLSPS